MKQKFSSNSERGKGYSEIDSEERCLVRKQSSATVSMCDDERICVKAIEYDTFSQQRKTFDSDLIMSPFRSKNRFYVLFLGCMMCFGGYFCMDQPNSLSKYLENSITGDSAMKYNLLYSVYSYPNIILPFFSGIFIDRLGLNIAVNILFVLCILGQGFFAFGGYIGDSSGFAFAILGRTLLGMGNESLSIVQSLFASKWFKGKELAFALALTLSIGRLGSVSNDLIMPIIAEKTNLGTALAFGLLLVLMSYAFCGILLAFEKQAQNHEAIQRDPEVNENIDCSYVKKFPASFWMITVSCVTVYVAIFSFNNISNDFFMDKYGFELKIASRLTSSIFIISAISCSIFGFMTDKVGYRVTLIVASSCLLFFAHLYFLMTPKCNQCYDGLLPLSMIGIAYSIYGAALWPLVPIVINEKHLGTAFGLTIALQNAGLGFGPNIVGFLESSIGGFKSVTSFFILVSAFGIMSGIIIYMLDKKNHKGVMQKPSKEIAIIQAEDGQDD